MLMTTVIQHQKDEECIDSTAPVSPVSGSEGIVDIDISEPAQGIPKSSDLGRISFDFPPRGWVFALPLLLQMETKVLQKDHSPRWGVLTGSLDCRTDTVRQEHDVPIQKLGEDRKDRLQRIFLLTITIWTSEMTHQHHRARWGRKRGVCVREREMGK